MPFDFKGFKANAAFSESYGDYSKDATPAGSAMISNRFDTDMGEFGVLLDLAYSKISSKDSNIIVPPYYATQYEGERVYAPKHPAVTVVAVEPGAPLGTDGAS